MLLRLQTAWEDEQTEEFLSGIGIRAVALKRYKMRPAPQEEQGCMVVHYSDLEKDQLSALVVALEQITTQPS